MKDFADKVAVVTGAASGIGRAMALRLADAKTKLVLADIDETRLTALGSDLKARGVAAVTSRVDVSRREDVERLARETLGAFGAAHLVFLNAGLASPPCAAWEKTLEDWALVLGVNLWGVIHGVRAFTPILIEQSVPGHVVITASAAGLIQAPFGADYVASKHAVVSIAESLHLELKIQKTKVKVSVLCPGFVRTRILENVDDRFRDRPVPPRMAKLVAENRRLLAEAIPPEELAEHVLEAIRAERFWILPHSDMRPYMEHRARSVREGKDPELYEPAT